MSKNHISVSPQVLTNYLTILDIKIIFSLQIHTEKVVCEHYNFITGLWTIALCTVPPLLMFGHVTYQGFPLSSIYHLPSVKQWPHNTMLQSDWLMLYIE